MQESNVTDLQFQPNTKDTYSFKKPFLKLEGLLSNLFTSIFLIIFLIPVIIGTILLLNYFNIIPLSQNYPNYFFDLPHKEAASQSIENVKLLSDIRIYSKETNSWFINAKFFKKQNNTVYFYYKNKLISLKFDKNSDCGIIDKDTIASDNSSDIQKIDCNTLFSKNNENLTFNIEYGTGENNNFTILSTQLDWNSNLN